MKQLFLFFLLAIFYFLFSNYTFAVTPEELRQNIKGQLQDLENQLEIYREYVTQSSSRAKTLSEEITRLEKKIKRQELEVKRLGLTIQKLDLEITESEKNIQVMDKKIEVGKNTLAESLKAINFFGNKTILELVLNKDKFSSLFSEIKSLEDAENRLYESLLVFKDLKLKLNIQKEYLDDEKEEAISLKSLVELEKTQLKGTQQQKTSLLKSTKGKEKLYQDLVKKTKKDITSLRNQLYILQGNEKLRFEDALILAEFASSQTGIRPAFLLAVLSRETNLGGNIGRGTWREDMSHPRCAKQKQAFLQITNTLGLDPDQVPVSRRQAYGYCGGAMGPAQFMPTTWLLYENRVAKITGNNPPSPWEMKDAFTAAALFLADSGAGKQTAAAEWKAAMIYLAGSNWSKSYLSFYGDSILELAFRFQEQIDILKKA